MKITIEFDPYRSCDDCCHHDLACGALTTDLLREDGPHDPMWEIGPDGRLQPLTAAEQIPAA